MTQSSGWHVGLSLSLEHDVRQILGQIAEAVYPEHGDRRSGCEGARARGMTVNSNNCSSGVPSIYTWGSIYRASYMW
jgi:hypothetical protein